MIDLEKEYLELYSFKKINEKSKVIQEAMREEDISQEEVEKRYKSYQDYIAKKLNIDVKEAKELHDKLSSEISQIQNVYERYTSKRRDGFKNFKEFYIWYETQLKKQKHGCYYCKTSFKDLEILFEKGLIKSKKFTATPHIERLDSDKGYKSENMVFACALCNNAKSDMISEDDFLKYFAKPMEDYLNEKIRK